MTNPAWIVILNGYHPFTVHLKSFLLCRAVFFHHLLYFEGLRRMNMISDISIPIHRRLKIDPIAPSDVQFNLTAPDGTKRMAQGKGDRFGYFTAKEKWPLDSPGYGPNTVNATWNGFKGRVPGIPDEGGYIFVLDNGSPRGPGMTLNLSYEQTFSPADGLEIQGNSSASQVHFAAITPGAVLDEGVLPVANSDLSINLTLKR